MDDLIVGVSRMIDLMLTGRTYGAVEGQALGLSHYLVEPGAGLAVLGVEGAGVLVAAQEQQQLAGGEVPQTSFEYDAQG